ncbi:MAG: hypothetical protein GY798_00290 [Hyphomicrobiales bacterium]|nr:hypothetical protein [Hyphomicrobiales bacterium]
MTDFIVEVSLPEPLASARIKDAIRTLGSHFATRANWRLREGEYTGAVMIDADDERTALAVVPPGLRTAARAVPATRKDDIKASLRPTGSRRWAPSHIGAPLTDDEALAVHN